MVSMIVYKTVLINLYTKVSTEFIKQVHTKHNGTQQVACFRIYSMNSVIT